jgi:hypothetical protein
MKVDTAVKNRYRRRADFVDGLQYEYNIVHERIYRGAKHEQMFNLFGGRFN